MGWCFECPPWNGDPGGEAGSENYRQMAGMSRCRQVLAGTALPSRPSPFLPSFWFYVRQQEKASGEEVVLEKRRALGLYWFWGMVSSGPGWQTTKGDSISDLPASVMWVRACTKRSEANFLGLVLFHLHVGSRDQTHSALRLTQQSTLFHPISSKF